MLIGDTMNDLEICKRINEIEGLTIKEATHYKRLVNGAGVCIGFSPHNPLKDDELCFQLMVKHKVDVDFTDDGYTRAWQYHHINGQDTLNKSPNLAICMAIIEANK